MKIYNTELQYLIFFNFYYIFLRFYIFNRFFIQWIYKWIRKSKWVQKNLASPLLLQTDKRYAIKDNI